MPQYECYIDNAQAGGLQLMRVGADVAGLPVIQSHAVVPITGLSDGTTYTNVYCPSAHPAAQDAAHLGGPVASDHSAFAPWNYFPFDGIVPSGADVVRFFLAKIRIKVQWSDGTHTVPITNRWVGGTIPSFRPGFVLPVNTGAYWKNRDGHYSQFGLTDASGICEYYGIVAVSWRVGGFWFRSDSFFLPTFATRETERTNATFFSGGDAPPGYTYSVGPSYQLEPYVPSYLGGVDYNDAFDAGTGLVTFPVAGILVASPAGSHPVAYTPPPITGYKAFAVFDVFDGASAPVAGASVSFGGGLFTGVTDGAGHVVIPCYPRGSWIDPTDSGELNQTITTVTIHDGSAYPASAVATDVGVPRVALPHAPVDSLLPVPYSGRAGGALASTSFSLKYGDFDGGEVVGLPYLDVSIVKGPTTYVAPGDPSSHLLVREDQYVVFSFTGNGSTYGEPEPDAEGLDYVRNPYGRELLFAAEQPDSQQYDPVDDDASYAKKAAIPATPIVSPSGVITDDYVRLQAGVSSGTAYLWRTLDNWETVDGAPAVIAAGTWTNALLRRGPDGRLHAWLTASGGAVSLATSIDGGATWNAISAVPTLPAGREERADVRHDGERWVRAHPEGSGINLYSSVDGETWVLEGTIASGAKHPWLVVHPHTYLICVYYATGSGELTSRRAAMDGSGAWVWGAESPILAVAETGPAAFCRDEKVVVAHRKSKSEVAWHRSLDAGDTWEDGSNG